MPIDLRSDTVTRPTPAMRAAMASAEVGDDVYDDDPTVKRLQDYAAERFGFEAALFMVSGTQSNLAGMMAHCGRGDEYLVGQQAHTYLYEQGGAAVLGSIQPQPLLNRADGTIAIEDIVAAIKPDDVHFARSRVLALENTIGGKVLPAAYVAEATQLAKSRGLSTHLDGARLWNAMIKTKASERELTAGFDSVSVCLSKGLGAPAGSLLLGSRDFIVSARRWRKMLGGGLRQVGILAAAGLYAMEHYVARLQEDHDNAAHLAAGLKSLGLAPEAVQTNMVFVNIPAAHVAPLADHLKSAGIVASIGPHTRFVTHLDVSRAQIEVVLGAMRSYFAT